MKFGSASIIIEYFGIYEYLLFFLRKRYSRLWLIDWWVLQENAFDVISSGYVDPYFIKLRWSNYIANTEGWFDSHNIHLLVTGMRLLYPLTWKPCAIYAYCSWFRLHWTLTFLKEMPVVVINTTETCWNHECLLEVHLTFSNFVDSRVTADGLQPKDIKQLQTYM